MVKICWDKCCFQKIFEFRDGDSETVFIESGRLYWRIYNVKGPNHLLHIDSNLKLVRWRFVVISGIGGFSRLVTFLKCADNNTSRTVLDCFLLGVDTYGLPVRVRSDKGLENVTVADYILLERGDGSMITGKSVINEKRNLGGTFSKACYVSFLIYSISLKTKEFKCVKRFSCTALHFNGWNKQKASILGSGVVTSSNPHSESFPNSIMDEWTNLKSWWYSPRKEWFTRSWCWRLYWSHWCWIQWQTSIWTSFTNAYWRM